MECSRKKYENDARIEKRKRGTCDIFMQRYGSSLINLTRRILDILSTALAVSTG